MAQLIIGNPDDDISSLQKGIHEPPSQHETSDQPIATGRPPSRWERLTSVFVNIRNIFSRRRRVVVPLATQNNNKLLQKNTPMDVFGADYLKYTSNINGIDYCPWNDNDSDNCGLLESTSEIDLFVDPNGLIKLNDAQQHHTKRWIRPTEICVDPKIGKHVSSSTIQQSTIANCSFVAAMITCAHYEERFKQKLVTSCIYPCDDNGNTVVRKNGKYLISLFVNGCWRKVIIDDQLPFDKYNTLMCTQSGKIDDFWPSLIEKGFMKVMGGYDSQIVSGHQAITGWIPESLTIKDCNEQDTFELLEKEIKNGNALFTMGISNSPSAESVGLVNHHEYAVLQACRVLGQYLLQLKNPWRQRAEDGGDYSQYDAVNWTKDLMDALHYNKKDSLNGVFWIDWATVRQHFTSIRIVWNPSRFQFQATIHGSWNKDIKEPLIHKSAQYSLQVKQSASVWILLSRHITGRNDIDDKYIALHVISSNGQKIYCTPDKFVYKGNVVTNSTHHLVKINVDKAQSYTVIPLLKNESRESDSMDIIYTVKVYSTCPITFSPVLNNLKYSQKLRAQWVPQSRNVKFILNLLANVSNIVIEVTGPESKDCYVWISLKPLVENREDDGFISSGNETAYSGGYSALELSNVPQNEYIIDVSTKEGYHGQFMITVSLDNDQFTLTEKSE